MWLSILGILNGLLDVGTRVLAYLSDEKLREAGRNEVRLTQLETQVATYAVVQDIDAKPTPNDKHGIIDRL